MSLLRKDYGSSIFIGLGKKSRQVRIPIWIYDVSHSIYMALTRGGKGLFLQTILLQMLRLERTVIVVDPRRDIWLPNVLGHECEELSLPFTYLDTNADIPQWAPLRGKSRNQSLALLAAAFDLEPKGDPSDFHKLKDRNVASLIAGNAELRELDWPSLYTRLLTDYPDEIDGADGFLFALRELAAEPFLQTNVGVDLATTIESGGVLYVTGDFNSGIQMRILRMFSLSVLQAALARGQGKGRRLELVLDEFRKLVSEAALDCLSMASGCNTHAHIVHQSLGDISQPVGSLSADAVRNIIASNCRNRLFFQSLDSETAKYVSGISGTRPVKRASASLDRNLVLNETKSTSSVLIEDEAPFVSENVMLSLPERCALLCTRGAPEFVYVCPVPTTQELRFTTPSTFGDISSPGKGLNRLDTAGGLIDVD